MADISAQVTLRPVAEDDLTVVQDMMDDPEALGEFEWTGWHDRHMWRRDWDRNGLRGEDPGIFMVARGDERLGIVSFRRKGMAAAFYWEIGIALLPAARGHGYGAQAQRQLVRYLFTHTPVNRIEAWTEAANIAEQRSLERAGFTREGVRRGAGWRGGAWRDVVLYGILRAEAGPPAQ
ncbi:MAG TPA: GNAT family protein [Trebonia sp.]|jgi:RimJ/RimL family protein N-acetyltransferase|nr:GNAT family protein [Trebonia sp.]